MPSPLYANGDLGGLGDLAETAFRGLGAGAELLLASVCLAARLARASAGAAPWDGGRGMMPGGQSFN
jgi:hypothetical protein